MNKYPVMVWIEYTNKDHIIELLKNMHANYSNYGLNSDENNLIFNYPTVYIIYSIKPNADKETPKYVAYAGETNNIIRRTYQHLHNETRADWRDFNSKHSKKYLCVIGDKYFNKSMTLDIENQIITYLSNDTDVDNGLSNKLYTKNDKAKFNRRKNNQNLYYGYSKVNSVFYLIWRELHRFINPNLFVSYGALKHSVLNGVLYLTSDQLSSLNNIYQRIIGILQEPSHGKQECQHHLKTLFINGAAGTGKTVLLNHLFYKLQNNAHITSRLVVNQNQQVKNYYNKFSLLGLDTHLSDNHIQKKLITKPERFINTQEKIHNGNNKVDVLLVDEAHLLYTQYNQGHNKHHSKAQLDDLEKYSRITVIVYDSNQILRLNEYNNIHNLMKKDNTITLTKPLRIKAGSNTIDWISSLAGSSFDHEPGKIGPVPKRDSKGYALKIYNDPNKMMNDIKRVNTEFKKKYVHKSGNIKDDGLCRVVATYDWKYKSPTKANHYKKFYVHFKYNNDDKFIAEWNGGLKSKKTWLDQEETINQVGSVYTIQGFDLNCVGLIIGPSITCRRINNCKGYQFELVYNYKKNCDKNIRHDKQFEKEVNNSRKTKEIKRNLVQNQLSTLLQRGVHGLFIYACDPKLRNALLKESHK